MYFKTQFIQLIYITALATISVSCNNNTKRIDNANKPDSGLVMNEAIKSISGKIDKEPENAEFYYQRAVLYFNDKHLERSLSDIDDAIKFDKKNALYPFYKGRILYALNRTKDAALAYETAISKRPDYEEAQLKLAELYYVVKEHQKSINLLNSIVAYNKLNAEAYSLRGDNQREIQDTARAIASYQKALEIDGNYYDAAMQLGLLFTAKRKPTAIDYFNTALRINPKSSEAYFGRAYYYQLTKQYQKSLFDYRKVIDFNPSSDLSYYNVGVINFDVQKYDEALRSWDICIQMNNQNIDAYYMRGLVYEYRKKYKEAQLNYKYALELNPDYILAREALARIEK